MIKHMSMLHDFQTDKGWYKKPTTYKYNYFDWRKNKTTYMKKTFCVCTYNIGYFS